MNDKIEVKFGGLEVFLSQLVSINCKLSALLRVTLTDEQKALYKEAYDEIYQEQMKSLLNNFPETFGGEEKVMELLKKIDSE